ncbi:5-formyltetrahydrofolate cyclo-ligase [Thermosulfurimonas marina]|uniref:5-formyltetrahydrofolate cyclo-ligase n=1 Tax=Thermosulfurimonas marina TaxID=2047767 RepID=A0A6H1WS78_9BACT|nr:5-formyltetrahydrofolate cyclo-ligase [Thermosulfurimonas marina]QJA06077.1 5-formyltetrahydrofolate cyclo-ligase [Thermosulfurimonas marina]
MEDIARRKKELREAVWRRLTEAGVARFPGAWGRIPNFVGAEEAARRALELPEVQRARVVFVNPDSPQYPLRAELLSAGKVLVMAAPKLSGEKPFLLLDPTRIKPHPLRVATLKGAFRYGIRIGPEEAPLVDLFVTGCVAVSPEGARLGKGGGFADREYALLLKAGRLAPGAPVLTTVHEFQILSGIPQEPHDLRVDILVTPERVLRVSRET